MIRQGGRRFAGLPAACLIIILIVALALTGCSNNELRSPLSNHTDDAAIATQPTHTFGIVYPMAHRFYEVVTEHAEQVARDKNVALIVKAPDEANLEQQIRIVETLIRQEVDGIAIDPIDSAALAPYINKAVLAGIPVICFESDSPESARYAYIGADNYQSGKQMGQAIDQLLGGRGMILLQTGMSRMRSLTERLDGFLAYVHEETEIEVLEVKYNEGSEERALLELEQMIDAHPHFDALVALDYISGTSSVLVWKAKGLNRYALTLGMMPELEEAIHNGQITSAISQNENTWGERIVNQLLLAQEGTADGPKLIDTGISHLDMQDIAH